MNQDRRPDPASKRYPLGRGYGHDYMRGGEVLGGYGYSDRDEYSKPRGGPSAKPKSDEASDGGPARKE